MSDASDQVTRNLIDYVRTLEPAEAVRELACVLSAVVSTGERLRDGLVDPELYGSVLVVLGGVASGMVEQIRTKPGGTPAAAKDPTGMCATQLVGAQIATMVLGA